VKEQEAELGEVRGERGATFSQAPSLQSRASNVLAIGLMSALGLGMLTWYYANALKRQNRAQQVAQTQSNKQVQGDMPLPSIGRIDPPPAAAAPAPIQDLPVQPAPLMTTPVREIPLQASQPGAAPPAPEKTQAQLAMERKLSGAAFASQGTAPNSAAAMLPGIPAQPAPALQESADLGALLRPTVTTAVRAQILPTQRLLLPKGAFLDCTLETAIDSTLPGMTTCVLATDSFGVDGQVVLLERGTKLVGETRGQVQQGSARIFVLWNEARTPTGVIVPLASPGADELGRSGLPGTVDRHFWERFGAAILVSVIDGAVQSAIQSSRGSSGTVIVNPSATQDVMTEVLKSTINIPPTVVKRQGDRIQVLVARDLDFRSVYELRSVAIGH